MDGAGLQLHGAQSMFAELTGPYQHDHQIEGGRQRLRYQRGTPVLCSGPAAHRWACQPLRPDPAAPAHSAPAQCGVKLHR